MIKKIVVVVIVICMLGGVSSSFAQQYGGRESRAYDPRMDDQRYERDRQWRGQYRQDGYHRRHERDAANFFAGALVGGVLMGLANNAQAAPRERESAYPPPQSPSPAVIYVNPAPVVIYNNPPPSSPRSCYEKIYFERRVWDPQKGSWVEFMDIEVSCE
ncbi:MAG: hypothetical protein ACD_15C00060G0005 [uncultured bacterium]|nr:MAG: hypothetical protein ACD_15C00060G0005 [uncultured bacterium]